MGLWINDSSGINSGGPVTTSLQNSSFGKMNSEVFEEESVRIQVANKEE